MADHETQDLDALFQAQQQRAMAPGPDVDAPERRAAEVALLAFIGAMHEWERRAGLRDREIASRHRRFRIDPNSFLPEESADYERLWAAVVIEKAALFEAHCVPGKRVHSSGSSGLSYRDPPAYNPARTHIIGAEQAGPRKMVLTTDAGPQQRFRFTLRKKGERWLVDFKERWDGGWKRAIL